MLDYLELKYLCFKSAKVYYKSSQIISDTLSPNKPLEVLHRNGLVHPIGPYISLSICSPPESSVSLQLNLLYEFTIHYSDAIMSRMVSQITGVSIVYSMVCSGADQRKHQSFASLAFVSGIHQWPVNFWYKGPVTQKMFPFDDVIMCIFQWLFISPIKMDKEET